MSFGISQSSTQPLVSRDLLCGLAKRWQLEMRFSALIYLSLRVFRIEFVIMYAGVDRIVTREPSVSAGGSAILDFEQQFKLRGVNELYPQRLTNTAIVALVLQNITECCGRAPTPNFPELFRTYDLVWRETMGELNEQVRSFRREVEPSLLISIRRISYECVLNIVKLLHPQPTVLLVLIRTSTV